MANYLRECKIVACHDFFTYELLRVARRETHAIARLALVIEVSAALKETEHGVEEGVETTGLLGHCHEHLVELGHEGRICALHLLH